MNEGKGSGGDRPKRGAGVQGERQGFPEERATRAALEGSTKPIGGIRPIGEDHTSKAIATASRCKAES